NFSRIREPPAPRAWLLCRPGMCEEGREHAFATRAAATELSTIFSGGSLCGLADSELLDRFLSARGELAELAFAALVERHGPMVLRVCRGIAPDWHDAEDAFQATFLVLARKATTIRKRDSLPSFLHGIAVRAARDVRDAWRR